MIPVAEGLSFPTSIAFGDDGTPYIAEAGIPLDGTAPGGRVVEARTGRCLLDDLRPPVNGLSFYDGALFVCEGGQPGRISRIDLDGTRTVLLDDLPGGGNYHTNMVAFGEDGWMYFSQGAMTNLGIVGPDGEDLAWLRRTDHPCDIPGVPVVLTGLNAALADGSVTGAFSPYGTPTQPGQRVEAGLPCTAAIMRARPDGTELELVAWGIRNAYGLGFLPDGRLLAIDQGADDRGSRPVGSGWDMLFAVEHGAWYGWPDFIGDVPVTAPEHLPTRGPAPRFLLASHDDLPPPRAPLVRFPMNTAPTRFAVAPPGHPWAGQLVVALFGDECPMTAPPAPQAGRMLARLDPSDWSLHPLPQTASLKRPIDVAFHPLTGELHALDFGHFEMTEGGGVEATAGSGALVKIPC